MAQAIWQPNVIHTEFGMSRTDGESVRSRILKITSCVSFSSPFHRTILLNVCSSRRNSSSMGHGKPSRLKETVVARGKSDSATGLLKVADISETVRQGASASLLSEESPVETFSGEALGVLRQASLGIDRWCGEEKLPKTARLHRLSLALSKGSKSSFTLLSVAPMVVYPLMAEGTGYSQASYYTSLGLFVISVPGIWSLVKRSTKSKVVKKTFSVPGPQLEEAGKRPSQIAGEITSSLGRNNFAVADRGETVTFEGTMVPSRGQAAFLSFCTAVSLACVALVLSITVPDVGDNWYYLTVLSPLAGFYYWTRASRKEQIKVKMVMADDESATDVIIQGDDEQIDRLRRELGLMEKGMVYVKGILER